MKIVFFIGTLLMPPWVRAADCVMVQELNAAFSYVSDTKECRVRTAPASTFKIPHALIAMETGVITDPLVLVAWDGSEQPNESWRRDHSMDSAIKASALWFFRRTAGLIGSERMHQALHTLQYAEDSFDGDVTSFWLNGDLLLSPAEQLDFMRRFAAKELPVESVHLDAVADAFLMPPGKVTLAAGERDFPLAWPNLSTVHAKTGNAAVDREYVSWLTGYFLADGRTFVFVSRSRNDTPMSTTAGSDLAARVLNEIAADGPL